MDDERTTLDDDDIVAGRVSETFSQVADADQDDPDQDMGDSDTDDTDADADDTDA